MTRMTRTTAALASLTLLLVGCSIRQDSPIFCEAGQTLNSAGDACQALTPADAWWEALPLCSTDSVVDTDTHPCLWDARVQGNGQGDVVVLFEDGYALTPMD